MSAALLEEVIFMKPPRTPRSYRQAKRPEDTILWGSRATPGAGCCGDLQTPESHSTQIHGAGRGATIPTSDKQELDLSCLTGGTREGERNQGWRENPEPVVKKRAAHIHTVMGGSSSSNTHSPLLYTSCHKLNFFPPSPLQPRAISPLPNQQHLLSTTAPTPGELFAL